jgi:predicted transcriptional regulator
MSNKEKILEFLTQSIYPASIERISVGVSLSKKEVSRRLSEMKKDGLIRKHDNLYVAIHDTDSCVGNCCGECYIDYNGRDHAKKCHKSENDGIELACDCDGCDKDSVESIQDDDNFTESAIDAVISAMSILGEKDKEIAELKASVSELRKRNEQISIIRDLDADNKALSLKVFDLSVELKNKEKDINEILECLSRHIEYVSYVNEIIDKSSDFALKFYEYMRDCSRYLSDKYFIISPSTIKVLKEDIRKSAGCFLEMSYPQTSTPEVSTNIGCFLQVFKKPEEKKEEELF